jgi:hypothetical protein
MMVKNINSMIEMRDHLIKTMEKHQGRNFSLVKEFSLTRTPENPEDTLTSVIKKRDAAIKAKENIVKRWDEEISRHERNIKQLKKQQELEKRKDREDRKNDKKTKVDNKTTGRGES